MLGEAAKADRCIHLFSPVVQPILWQNLLPNLPTFLFIQSWASHCHKWTSCGRGSTAPAWSTSQAPACTAAPPPAAAPSTPPLRLVPWLQQRNQPNQRTQTNKTEPRCHHQHHRGDRGNTPPRCQQRHEPSRCPSCHQDFQAALAGPPSCVGDTPWDRGEL